VEDFDRQMAYLVQHCRLVSLDDMMAAFRSGRQLPLRSVVVTFDDGYADNYTHAFPILRKYGVPAAIFVVHDYIATTRRYPWDDGTEDHALSWDQIFEMQAEGITFGCHTLSHPLLNDIRPEDAFREIHESKVRLEQRLGLIRYFAYPRGERRDFSAAIKSIVAKEGFVAACSTIPGTNRSDGDWYELRRTVVEPIDASPFQFRLLMMGVTDVILGLFRHGWASSWLTAVSGRATEIRT
jgi:peptidoglycan/xylan/chitin deacetylase (PgdA/CDA1 family)